MTCTPDDAKKGPECCAASYADCHKECPYKPDCDGSKILKDALALIQQLQSENAEKDQRIRVLESRNNALYHTILGVMHFVDKWIDDAPAYDPDEDLSGTTAIGRAAQAREIALHAIEQLQAERDAAVKSLRGRCFECKHNKTSVCLICSKDKELKYWQWRGVQKEE